VLDATSVDSRGDSNYVDRDKLACAQQAAGDRRRQQNEMGFLNDSTLCPGCPECSDGRRVALLKPRTLGPAISRHSVVEFFDYARQADRLMADVLRAAYDVCGFTSPVSMVLVRALIKIR